MSTKTIIGFLTGLLCGLGGYHAAMWFGGFTVLPREEIRQQEALVAELRAENRELTEELFRPRGPLSFSFEEHELPYDGDDDASGEVAAAREAAAAEKKYLMVTFGANWCRDCLNLHRILHSEDVEAYTRDLFRFANVDVGKFNQNRHVADALGVTLRRGIPVAVFFDPDGRVIGTTNEGQLEPARRYTSKQILKFVRDIVERSQIASPDSVE